MIFFFWFIYYQFFFYHKLDNRWLFNADEPCLPNSLAICRLHSPLYLWVQNVTQPWPLPFPTCTTAGPQRLHESATCVPGRPLRALTSSPRRAPTSPPPDGPFCCYITCVLLVFRIGACLKSYILKLSNPAFWPGRRSAITTDLCTRKQWIYCCNKNSAQWVLQSGAA